MKNEEKIKEIMNKISLALNDATLQQGFEIICKSYSELNKQYDLLNDFTNNQAIKLLKENKELKTQIEKMKADIRENIKWADQNKNNQMWQKLVKMMNEWSKI